MNGTWCIEGYPREEGGEGRGLMFLDARADGERFDGRLRQLILPSPSRGVWSTDEFVADITGQVVRAKAGGPAVMTFVRRNIAEPFAAVFTGLIAPDGNEVTGRFYNTCPGQGRFIMYRADLPTDAQLAEYVWRDGYQMPPDR